MQRAFTKFNMDITKAATTHYLNLRFIYGLACALELFTISPYLCIHAVYILLKAFDAYETRKTLQVTNFRTLLYKVYNIVYVHFQYNLSGMLIHSDCNNRDMTCFLGAALITVIETLDIIIV